MPLDMRSVLTFIMAGGRGERLYPLTKDRAKPAVPFGGIYRIIDFTLSNCINSGIRKIHVLTQYKSVSLHNHLRKGWHIFDSELGEYIDVIPAHQGLSDHWYLGTADAIYQNIDAIEQEHSEYVLILAGDHIYKMNYARMLQWHREREADLTVAVIEMERSRAQGLGVAEVDDRYRVIGFEEKPAVPRALSHDATRCYVSMGIYLFNRSVVEQVLRADAARSTSHDFGRDIIPRMLADHRVCAYNFKDENLQTARYWRDIGTLNAYYEANMDLVQVTPSLNLYDRRWPIRTYHEQVPPAKTVFAQEEGGRVGVAVDSLVANGCIISGGRVERSILSTNVRINSYSEVQDAVLMEGVDVGRYARIRRAIVDKDVKIPRHTTIGYDAEQDRRRFHVTASGIVVVAKGTLLDEAATPPAIAAQRPASTATALDGARIPGVA